jgi:hypothetical protein
MHRDSPEQASIVAGGRKQLAEVIWQALADTPEAELPAELLERYHPIHQHAERIGHWRPYWISRAIAETYRDWACASARRAYLRKRVPPEGLWLQATEQREL